MGAAHLTIYRPDAPDIPEAWFKHSEPHALWGIFPRLAYEIFADRKDGWKVTMKYFQNVVDTVGQSDVVSVLLENLLAFTWCCSVCGMHTEF